MLTNILLGLLAYGLCMLVFMLLWCAWQDRMHDMDEAMAKAFEEDCRLRGK